MSTARDLERLERDYRERKAQIRADASLSWEKREDASLSWEKRELAIKQLGEEHHARRRELEMEAA
jgi:hypothetical protein